MEEGAWREPLHGRVSRYGEVARIDRDQNGRAGRGGGGIDLVVGIAQAERDIGGLDDGGEALDLVDEGAEWLAVCGVPGPVGEVSLLRQDGLG